jgi:endo-1,4-beta-xylanase
VKLRRSVAISALSLTAVLAAQTMATAGSASPTRDSGQSPGVSAPVPHDSLRALASRVGLRIGTAVNTDALAANATYAQITGNQFSTVTPENVMKWQVVEPTQGTYDWTAADRLVSFAAAHGQLVRGHTLVWQNQLPDWLTAGTFTSAQLRALLRKHIMDEVSHFRGHIWQWDVVNEAFNDNGTMRDTIWLQALGAGYIADAFRWAHQADRHALLFYNDYNIEGTGAKSDAVYAMVKQLRHQGVPIDGVGLQTHLDTQYGFPEQMQQNMQRFADLGLKLALTEVDVRTFLPVTSTEELAQNADYSQSLQACLLVRQCISYTVWGFGDAYSWVPSVFAGEGAADIYDENLQPKASYGALQQDLVLDTGAPQRAR